MIGRVFVILARAKQARLGENSRNEILGMFAHLAQARAARLGEDSWKREVMLEGLAQARSPSFEWQSTSLKREVLA